MKKGLAFSGGKDSWACLWLLEKELADIDVIWINTEKNFPEVLQTIERAKLLCPNFHEVKTNQDANLKEWGLPTEVIAEDWTRIGHLITGEKSTLVQSYIQCCYANISHPMHVAAKKLGVEILVRGQRSEEAHKGASVNGTVVNGLRYQHPIENWSAQEVLTYLTTKMELPEHFRFQHSSMDCYDCTAFRKDHKDRQAHFKATYPLLYTDYRKKLSEVDMTIHTALEF